MPHGPESHEPRIGRPLRIARRAKADERAGRPPCRTWTILVVDDDREVHEATAFSLHGLTLLGRSLRFESAYSADEAFARLRDGLRPSVILLDVVMESPSAGLDLVRRIRDELGLTAPRVILRTGQPGYAPEADIVARYDIDDYRTKADLSQVSLLTSIMGALRAYQSIRALEFAAFTDALTGLPNRQGLIRRLDALPAAAASRCRLALADLRHFIDIDGSLGHDLGDRVLMVVADRLSRIAGVETVARLHGDVFGLIGPPDLSETVILDAIAAPIAMDGHVLSLDARIGFAALRQDGDRGARAVRDASIALNRAKKARGRSSCVYDDRMEHDLRWRLQTFQALREAFEARALQVWYQPQVDLRTGRVVGVEALARWPGGQPPDVFIPLAEYSGLIVPLGRWVIETAIADMLTLDAAGNAPLRLSVNVSVEQIRAPGFASGLTGLLTGSAFSARRLQIEITESVLVDEPERVTAELSGLRTLGVGVALDDFGAGHASISCLRDLPIDAIKIDRGFVDGIGAVRGGSFARLIVDLAQDLGLASLAEGVETEEQAAFLRTAGCHAAQGFLYARPMPAGDLAGWLSALDGRITRGTRCA